MTLPVSDLANEQSTPLERGLETLTRRIDAIDVPIDRLWNPATCPEAHLPWLAFALSIDFWREDWSTATKRAAIAASLIVHRRKGTVAAVRAAVAAIAGAADIDVREWFQPGLGGAPYTATLDADLTDADPHDDARPDLHLDMVAAARASGNVRSRFNVRLLARPTGHQRVASRLQRPITRVRSAGQATYVHGLRSRFATGGLIRRPVVIADVTRDGAPILHFNAAVSQAAVIRRAVVAARVTASGARP